jgi:hypothetical protein
VASESALARRFDSLARLSSAQKLSVSGLTVTAAGMLLQIAAGSMLYPTLAGPIVLLGAAVAVAFGPGRWTRYLGLLIPAVLALGAMVAAVMTGDFLDQLADAGRPGILLGSVLHVLGLVVAIAAGIGMFMVRRVGRA